MQCWMPWQSFFNKDLSTSSRFSFSMLRSISPEAYCIAMGRMSSAAWLSFLHFVMLIWRICLFCSCKMNRGTLSDLMKPLKRW